MASPLSALDPAAQPTMVTVAVALPVGAVRRGRRGARVSRFGTQRAFADRAVVSGLGRGAGAGWLTARDFTAGLDGGLVEGYE
ncbi:MAG: hypothetical protein Tsb0020_43490 [Haliangiales bacterium]